MRHTFTTSQWVPCPVARVFAFFADPANLPRLMPSWQRARIEHSSIVAPPSVPSVLTGVVAGAGSQMTISFRPLPFVPIRMTWKASVVEFAWNQHFCDEQPHGPFAYWRHCHRVSEEMQGQSRGTRVVDYLIYELPLGTLSEPVHRLFVRGQIEKIFAYRQQQLMKLLGGRE